MSVETWVISSDFSFIDSKKALLAIKSHSFKYDYKNIENAENLFEAFESWNLVLKRIGIDNYHIQSNGDCPGDESELFHVISPYIINGGYINLGVGENEIVNYYFDGKQCKEKSSLVGIDGFYNLIFIFTNEVSLSDCIKGLEKSFNYMITKNNKTCEVLLNDNVCAHITISNRGQKLFKKFQYEQGQVIEAKIADGDLPRIEKLLLATKCIVLVKFSTVISSADFTVDYMIDWEAFNNAKKAQGIYWKNYFGLCEENGIFCVPQEGYFNVDSDEPILNLDY